MNGVKMSYPRVARGPSEQEDSALPRAGTPETGGGGDRDGLPVAAAVGSSNTTARTGPSLGRAEARPEHEHRPQLASLHSVTVKTSQSGRGEQMHKILPAWPKRPHTEQALDFPVARCRALTSMGNSENVSNFD